MANKPTYGSLIIPAKDIPTAGICGRYIGSDLPCFLSLPGDEDLYQWGDHCIISMKVYWMQEALRKSEAVRLRNAIGVDILTQTFWRIWDKSWFEPLRGKLLMLDRKYILGTIQATGDTSRASPKFLEDLERPVYNVDIVGALCVGNMSMMGLA